MPVVNIHVCVQNCRHIVPRALPLNTRTNGSDLRCKLVGFVTIFTAPSRLRSYKRVSVSQHQEVSKILMTNLTSESGSVKGGDQQMCGTLGGIHNCTIGNITFNIGKQ